MAASPRDMWRVPDPLAIQQRKQQKQAKRRLQLQIVLFVLTVMSTALIGGWGYSIALILILLCHEMGHYVAARYYRVQATLPYFIPFPNLFGTFGAVIRMSGIIPNRKALFDIGIMGPLLGVVIAIPVTIIGLHLSTVVEVSTLTENTIPLGDSILFALFSHWIHGPLAEGQDILLHPVAFAGWAGLFVTALNLIPIGQLDGGHVIYALFYKQSTRIYTIVFALFVTVAVLYNPGWVLFLVLIWFFVRLQHPPTLDDEAPLGRTRVVYGIIALIFFLLTFPPIPIKLGG